MKAELKLLYSTYAAALFEYGKEKKILDKLINDFKNAVFIFKSKKNLSKVIKDPRIGLEDKERLLEAIYEKIRFSEDFLQFMKLLVNRKRFALLHGTFLKFRAMYNTYKDQAEVFLYSSTKLDRDVVDKVKNNLKKTLKKEIIVEEKQDEKLVGGIKIQLENKVYDGSVKRELEIIREKIAV